MRDCIMAVGWAESSKPSITMMFVKMLGFTTQPACCVGQTLV